MINRRSFLMEASALTALVLVRHRWPVADTLRVGVHAPNNGVVLGVEESKHAAAMFGGDIELVDPSHAASANLAGSDPALCLDLARRGALVLNVASGSDDLRGGKCAANMFHVAPSDAMVRDAARQAVGAAASDVLAWDASLKRFGADTLNQRFRARFNSAMIPADWTSWMAIKILWESSLRTKSTQSQTLIEHLRQDATQFDGHKGRPLSFRRWDNQLRQPLYVRRGSSLIEVPDANDDETSRDELDRLGALADRSACRMGR